MNNEIIKALSSYVISGKIKLESIKDESHREAVRAKIEEINDSMIKYEEALERKQEEVNAIQAEYENKMTKAKVKIAEKMALEKNESKEIDTMKVSVPKNSAKTKKTKTK